MFIERKFRGSTPLLMVYFMTIAYALFAAIVTLFSLISTIYLAPLFFLPMAALVLWLITNNKISWVHFRREHVTIKYIFGSEEIIKYTNLQQFSVKYEGFNTSFCSIQFLNGNQKIRKVDFMLKGLGHQAFNAELIELKKLNA